MGSISRYIFRTTFGAFLVVLVSLTAVIWVTQALRDFRWLIEELRVSLFAQELGAKGGVSAKKLATRLSQLR